jgi:hypothetical protein
LSSRPGDDGGVSAFPDPARLVLLAAALAGLLVSAPRGRAASTDKYAAWLAYSRCMRSHGVPTFPDPKQVAGGIQISGTPAGIDPGSPLFLAAQQSCRRLLPGGGRSTPAAQQDALGRMLRSSRCMRAHGVPGFPDPTLSPPSSRAGYADVMSNGVAWLAIPDSIDVRSPAFDRAAGACGLGAS